MNQLWLVTAPAASELYSALGVLDRALLRKVNAAWGALQLSDLQGSFDGDFVPVVSADLTRAQTTAAALGAGNMLGRPVGGAPQPLDVVPESLAGVSSGGGGLPHLLAQPLIETYVNLEAGMPVDQALASGMDAMDRILTTQVQDAARIAGTVALVTDQKITYYVRVVELGACGRCVILAGRKYKWNTGFLRHPSCRCLHVKETDDVGAPSAQELFNGMTPAQRVRSFGVAGSQAIELGASPGQVVNARRGMSTTQMYGRQLSTTTYGGRRNRPRLMPESIIALADGDRDLAVDLLRRNGFIR